MNVLYHHGNSVLNSNSCYLKYFQSNLKGIQINTILNKSKKSSCKTRTFPLKDIDKPSIDKIQMKMDSNSRGKISSDYRKLPSP